MLKVKEACCGLCEGLGVSGMESVDVGELEKAFRRQVYRCQELLECDTEGMWLAYWHSAHT